MLSPALSATPPEPDSSEDPPHPGGRQRGGLLVFVLAVVAAVAAIAFPFAPVVQPHATYSWTASDGAAAIPLMPYQPVQLTASVDCAVARTPGELLLSTTPPGPDPAALPLSGLTLTATGAGVQVTSAGVALGAADLPTGDCRVTVASDHARTVVSVAGRPVLTHEGDVRPDVAGAFTDARTGVELSLTTDTRFQTTISPVKAALGVICVLALLAMFVALARLDPPSARLLPRRWWRPRPVDAVVAALLAAWWFVGAITVDDGYISGIIRSRGENGFIGNVYRWLNAPEAPFSWFYDVFALWARIGGNSTLWMRLPATLLGLVCWVLLSRFAVPRLGRFAARRSVPWLTALTFGTWWIPFNLGLRPEPWVAVGVLGTFLAVERTVATRRVLPLAVGLLVAGATTALTPGGLIAFMPFLAGLMPVLRVLKARRDLHTRPILAVLLASPAAALLLMTYDQSFAAVLEGTRVRALIGGGLPWYQEYERYASLLDPGSFQASIGRRAAVLFTMLAAGGVLWALRRHPGSWGRTGIATGPARRLVATFWLGLVAMSFTPTKWTQHFGDMAGIGAAVLVLGLVAFAGSPLRSRARPFVVALAAVTEIGALVLAGYSNWPYASDWFAPTFSTLAPRLAGIALSTYVLTLGALAVVALVAREAWLRVDGAATVTVPRRVPAPAPIVAVALVAVLVLQVGGLARVAVAHDGSYTLASDAVATLRGEPCGLERLLSVETDPAAGMLAPQAGSVTRTERSVDVGGTAVAGIAVAGTFSTGWFVLDAAQRAGRLPVVVTTSGSTRPGDSLTMDFAGADALASAEAQNSTAGAVVAQRRITSSLDAPRDVRLMAPAGADAVRLSVDAPTGDDQTAALVSLPRVPRLTPMETLLPPGSSAVLDWPVAFLFGCITPEALPLGTADLPQWEVGTPASDPAAGITYDPGFGGPFAAPRQLVTEQRMPTYLAGDPTRDAAQLYRWIPITDLARPRPVVADETVMGWQSDGRTRVPGLDRVG